MAKPSTEFSGRCALVTGAARGIGAAVARALLHRGLRVAALDIRGDELQALASDRRASDRLRCHAVDVSHGAAVARVVAEVEADLGPIDYLVNVAGVLKLAPAVELSDEDWAWIFGVNAAGVFHVSRSVARHMMPRRRGAIVTVGSNAAAVPRMGMAAYAASKAAAAHFTRCLGLELAAYGIRCNLVSPGSTDTEMQRLLWNGDEVPDSVLAGSLEEYRTGIPLRRIAAPEDIAEAVLFLLSDRARHITLHDLRVDGGATLGV